MKVISLADKKKQKQKQDELAEDSLKKELSFDDIEKQNEANKKRVEKERLANNKKVLRSYRIKQ
jgi:hypothetical protein